MLDEIEEGLLAPVQVVEHAEEWPGVRGRLDRLPERPGDLLARGCKRLLAEQRTDGRGDRRLELRVRQLLQHLQDRPVRDALAVGQARPLHHVRFRCRGDELGAEARLPDSRRPEDREQVTRALGAHALPGVGEQALLSLPPDHRHLVPPRWRRGDREQSMGRDGRVLSLQLERRQRLDLDGVPDERQRRRTEQDVARLRRLFQPRRHVDGVARREPLLGAGYDLTRRHADPPRDAEIGEGFAHLGGRPHRAERVVLVHDRDAEHGHHGVADELLDGAAVRLHDRPHAVEVAGEKRPKRLGVEPFSEAGRAGDVAEEHRHRLARLAWDGQVLERRRAVGTEAEVACELPAAARAGRHARSLRTLSGRPATRP